MPVALKPPLMLDVNQASVVPTMLTRRASHWQN
jgi:hypothetical protein